MHGHLPIRSMTSRAQMPKEALSQIETPLDNRGTWYQDYTLVSANISSLPFASGPRCGDLPRPDGGVLWGHRLRLPPRQRLADPLQSRRRDNVFPGRPKTQWLQPLLLDPGRLWNVHVGRGGPGLDLLRSLSARGTAARLHDPLPVPFARDVLRDGDFSEPGKNPCACGV